MGMAIAGEVFVGASFSATVSCSINNALRLPAYLTKKTQPLTFAIASEVLPHRHRLAGQACLNSVRFVSQVVLLGFEVDDVQFAAGGSIFSLLLGSHLIQTQGPESYRTVSMARSVVY